MRKIFITLAIALMAWNANAQTVVRDGKNFTQVATQSQGQKTGFTFTDKDGKLYDIYVGKTGSCYILKPPRKPGRNGRNTSVRKSLPRSARNSESPISPKPRNRAFKVGSSKHFRGHTLHIQKIGLYLQ